MSSTCLSRFGAARIYALRAPFRVAAYCNTRSFTASAAKRSNLVDIAVAGPMAVLDGFHSFGIPWFASIPLSAVLVRTLFAHFLSGRRARRRAQLQNILLPLTMARFRQDRAASWERKGRTAKTKLSPSEEFWDRLEAEWIRRRIERKFSKDYGLGSGRLFGFLNFGILIAFTEAIRLKCAAREGLLPFLVSIPGQIGEVFVDAYRHPFGGGRVSPPGPNDAVEDMAENPVAARDHHFDPAMQTEGLPWMADLTTADPNVLPVLLFLSMAGRSLLPGAVATKIKPLQELSPDIEQRIVAMLGGPGGLLRLLFATALMFASMKMPAAIPLYWASSNVAGLAYARWLNWKYPVRPAVVPCRRPLRRKTKSRS